MEQTLIIFKPDAVQRGIVGEILTRFERAGLKVVGMKMLQPDYDHFHHHYEAIGTMITRHGERIFKDTLGMMQLGPVIAVVLEGIEAVELVRKMVGPTEPKSAQPGTIRGDYAHMTYGHSSAAKRGIPNEAKAEIDHWFSDSELFDYRTAHEHLTQRRGKHKK